MSAPDRIYAVGDVHGHLDKLTAIHAAIEADLALRPASAAVLHIGDYVDRGPDSAGVIQRLIDRQAAGHADINLLGNHDRMFRCYLDRERDPKMRPDMYWLMNRLGGIATLRSYGIQTPDEMGVEDDMVFQPAAANAVPAAHKAFLHGLRDSYHWGGWFFAHAGVHPGLALMMQDEDDLIWIRGPFLDSTRDHGATIVHGHTPVRDVEDHGNRIAIDTGAGYGGPLTCLVLEADTARILNGPQLR